MGKKKLKKTKKAAAYALASALVLSNLAFIGPVSAAQYKPGDLESKVKQLKQFEEQKLGTESSVHSLDSQLNSAKAKFKATDKVRVIVELNGQTPVEYATKQGKLYKQLSEDKKNSLHSKAVSQQSAVKDMIKSKGVGFKVKQNFTTAFNGFSGDVAFGDISKIEAIDGVKKVYIANEYKRPITAPNMKTSYKFIQNRDTWTDSGFKGEGMVVAVIDTGIDPSHRDFKITDSSKEELTKDKVGQLVQKDGLKGKFYTDKVPYGYNYFDQNDNIVDSAPNASMHGMHVAGIVAANGDEANGGIKGVAPEAQVLAMKVFSNDPNYESTSSDIYLAAIDDSIKLGAEVLNMSLGSAAAFYDKDSAEDLAIKRATENGIVCAVSAGNSQTLGYGWDNPFAENPDIGVVGAPGLNPDTISVAASGNEAYWYQHKITLDGNSSFASVGYGLDDWTQMVKDHGGKLQLVSLGDKLGNPDDYKGIDVKGKVVVVPRGSLTFADKTKYAAQAGAAGIIVWNATNGYFYQNQGGWDIPFMMIPKTDGQALNAAIAAGQTTLNVSQLNKSEDPQMGRMTDFTSWGTTPDLEMKPEITAPGGNIYSTVNNNKYEVMSGTSMAAPHVAGGSALVQQYLESDKRFSTLSSKDRTHLAKILLMNTAKVIDDTNGNPFSPRREGAGMMQIHSAVKTPVYVVNKSTGEPKVELKDFQSKQFEMTFTAKNISDKNATYKVNASVLTDMFQKQKNGPDYNALESGSMEGAKVTAPDTITVPAGQSVDFTVKVDLSNAKIPGYDLNNKKIFADLKEDIFVEGSVNLKGDGTPDLTVPYVGFYGKWDRPSIVDGFKDLGEDRFFDGQGKFDYIDKETGKKVEVPVHDMLVDDNFAAPVPNKDPKKAFWAISPNGDQDADTIDPFPAFLRNAREVQFNILDANQKLLRQVKLETDDRKTFYDSGKGSFYSYDQDRTWDGTVGGKTVKDGLYYYEIKSVVDYNGAQYQSKKIPVLVDTTPPKVEATYDPKKGAVTWKTTETGSGVELYGIYVDGKLIGTADGTATSYVIPNPPEKAVVEVVAQDYAHNYGQDTAAIGDVDTPIVFVDKDTPQPYGTFKTPEVPVKGYVTEDIGLKSFKVNGQEVPVTKDPKTGHFNFSTTVKFDKDGMYGIKVEATDNANKTYSIVRTVIVDTTKGTIDVDAPNRVDKKVDEVTLNVKLHDNFNYLDFFVGDNNVYHKSFQSESDIPTPADATVPVKVPLNLGENHVTLKLYDIAGNETDKEVVINRADPTGWVQDGDQWYYYDQDGTKHTGWLEEKNNEEDSIIKYYFDKDGSMHTGWLELGGKRYYFDKSGVMATDYTYVPESKNYYYFDENGVAQTGIQTIFGGYSAYFDATSGLLRNGWKLVDGNWYYADKDGRLETGWLYQASKWYFFNQDGKMQTGWLNDGKNSYYFTPSGAMAVGWTKVDGKWYYFSQSGSKVTGWMKDGQKWYFLDKNGVMQTGWIQDSGKWYYLNSSGDMAVGWKFVGGKWYYLNNSGDMATGWKQISGKWYYFKNSGEMAVNTTINGYKLGKDGAWIK